MSQRTTISNRNKPALTFVFLVARPLCKMQCLINDTWRRIIVGLCRAGHLRHPRPRRVHRGCHQCRGRRRDLLHLSGTDLGRPSATGRKYHQHGGPDPGQPCSPARLPTTTSQARAALPSRCTVQAPHCAIPQPNLVPVSCSSSRNTHKSGVSGGLSLVTACPFKVNLTMPILLSRPWNQDNRFSTGGKLRRRGGWVTSTRARCARPQPESENQRAQKSPLRAGFLGDLAFVSRGFWRRRLHRPFGHPRGSQNAGPLPSQSAQSTLQQS